MYLLVYGTKLSILTVKSRITVLEGVPPKRLRTVDGIMILYETPDIIGSSGVKVKHVPFMKTVHVPGTDEP